MPEELISIDVNRILLLRRRGLWASDKLLQLDLCGTLHVVSPRNTPWHPTSGVPTAVVFLRQPGAAADLAARQAQVAAEAAAGPATLFPIGWKRGATPPATADKD